MSKTQDLLLLVVLPNPGLSPKEIALVKFARKLSRGLGTEIEILIFRPPSLAHYGEVDTLASFKDKNAFISYAKGLDRDEEDKLDQQLHHICPEAGINFLQKDELGKFLQARKKEILFALTLHAKNKNLIFPKRPAFFKILEKNSINVLEIRDTFPVEKQTQALNPAI